jgi:Fe-S oxidoreductase
VDIATYKAEFLSHYWEGRLRPRHAYAFGWVDQWARLASLWPGMVNLVTQTPGLSHIAKLAAGMPLQRRIPEFAPQTFQQWFSKRRQQRVSIRGKVILWPDTFNNYFFPETAQAATEVLEHSGFDVQVPQKHLCCGRPLYDYGMLDQAKIYLRRVLNALRPQLEAGMPVVVLEPSCASVFRDELHNLFPDDPLAKKLKEQTMLLSEFLDKKVDLGRLPRIERKALVQGHCHHKSLLKFEAENTVMQKIGLDFEVLASGCCGMAGSFGFESDKYDVSIQIGERKLLPAVRKAPLSTMIMADGFSCREQISQQSNREALHLAEVIHMGLQPDDRADDELYPEETLVKRRKSARRKARLRALAVLAGAAAVGAFTWNQLKNR